MGAARIRKLNGSYPMFLSAKNLLLPNVPASAREGIRRSLEPYLSRVACQRGRQGGGDCWNIAQQLMKAADSPRVTYVEGLYDAVSTCVCCVGDYSVYPPPSHGWNTVDGYIVDLTLEHRWMREPELNRDWVYVPFKEYTQAEVRKYIEEIDDFDGYSITPYICGFGMAEEFGLSFTDADRLACEDHCKDSDEMGWEEIIFKPAIERLELLTQVPAYA